LCAQLESGRYAERQRLPSERELVAQFGVSCMTVRRALVALTQEVLIYGQARKGTFICVPKLDQQFFSENLPIEYVRSQYRGERYEFTAMVTTTR
jgi:DNA-binding GntR family transcriptional regulator